MNREDIVVKLKRIDVRMTSLWQSILNFFDENQLTSFTAMYLFDVLREHHPKLNKSSLYRKLAKLEEAGILNRVELEDRDDFYEFVQPGCHHHIVCKKCNNVIHVDIPNDQINKLQKELSDITGATIDEHVLEFYGDCNRC